VDTVGLYNPTNSVFYLRNSNSAGFANKTFQYGPANFGWTPIAGDWDGDGIDTIGLYNPSTSVYYLRNNNSAGFANKTFQYGPADFGWTPIAGDWDGDGIDTIGLYNPSTSVYYLRNNNSAGFANETFQYGSTNCGWTPIVGDWNGSTSHSLLAAGGKSTESENALTLTTVELRSTVSEAVARWAAAGLNESLLEKLQQVEFVIADLSGSQLGKTDGKAVYIDVDAAGYGWFVDSTPSTDTAFTYGSALEAAERIDLLTVVEHELGHVLGLDDLNALSSDVMARTLGTGTRRTVSHQDIVDAVFASS
jgi:ribosomal protein S16